MAWLRTGQAAWPRGQHGTRAAVRGGPRGAALHAGACARGQRLQTRPPRALPGHGDPAPPMPPPQDTRKCVWMEGPPVSLCAIRNGPTASLPPLQGRSWRRTSPLFPFSDSKAIESCAQTRSARQWAGEGRRSHELQPTGPLALSEPLSPRPSPGPPPRAARRGTDEGLEGPRREMRGTGHCQNSQSQAVRPGHADNSQCPTRARRDRGDTSLPLRPLNPNPGYRLGHTCPWWGRPSPDAGRGPRSGPRGPCALAACPHQALGARGPDQGGAPSAHCLGSCTRQAGLISGRELGAAKQDPPCRGASRAVPTLSQASWGDRGFCRSGQKLTC